MILDARQRHLDAQEDLAHMFEWREWFGFRPGWAARRDARVQARLSAPGA
jgi:hypothetical protein